MWCDVLVVMKCECVYISVCSHSLSLCFCVCVRVACELSNIWGEWWCFCMKADILNTSKRLYLSWGYGCKPILWHSCENSLENDMIRMASKAFILSYWRSVLKIGDDAWMHAGLLIGLLIIRRAMRRSADTAWRWREARLFPSIPCRTPKWSMPWIVSLHSSRCMHYFLLCALKIDVEVAMDLSLDMTCRVSDVHADIIIFFDFFFSIFRDL